MRRSTTTSKPWLDGQMWPELQNNAVIFYYTTIFCCEFSTWKWWTCQSTRTNTVLSSTLRFDGAHYHTSEHSECTTSRLANAD